MKYFALTMTFPTRPVTRRKTTKNQHGFMMFNSKVLIFALIFAAALGYLFQVNAVSTKGYEIKNLEKRVNELTESNKRLETEAASLESIQNLESGASSLNLVPAGQVKHALDEKYAFDRP